MDLDEPLSWQAVEDALTFHFGSVGQSLITDGKIPLLKAYFREIDGKVSAREILKCFDQRVLAGSSHLMQETNTYHITDFIKALKNSDHDFDQVFTQSTYSEQDFRTALDTHQLMPATEDDFKRLAHDFRSEPDMDGDEDHKDNLSDDIKKSHI